MLFYVNYPLLKGWVVDGLNFFDLHHADATLSLDGEIISFEVYDIVLILKRMESSET